MHFARAATGLDRLQICDEIALLSIRQLQMEMIVVMVDHLMQIAKAAVVVEAALVDFLQIP
jgi:hypothetical protein